MIAERARRFVLEAIEKGWTGPPFDPFELAECHGVIVVAREDVDDARLLPEKPPRIEFNPNRQPARVRFSIAHELGHLLFPDHSEQVRHRRLADSDEWQLEMLCNIAAAEFLMPAGSFPDERVDDLSLPHLLDLRTRFGVSTEAVLRRAVRLTERPVALFAATRIEEGARIDYIVNSRAWTPAATAGYLISPQTVLRRCTAVGFTADDMEDWAGESLRVQAVGVPPYPGHRFPRIVGLLQPSADVSAPHARLRYVRGDATSPQDDRPIILAHIVNDRARRWWNKGFAGALARTEQQACSDYANWAESQGHPKLAEVHFARVRPSLTVASMVAQSGYGEDTRPRIRLAALDLCLKAVAVEAITQGAVVHMPLIGTGQGGMSWPTIRDLIVDSICGRGISVTIYILPESPMPIEIEKQISQLSLL